MTNSTEINSTASNPELRKAQMIMCDILVEIDAVCRRHNLKYWLDAGTLLGAVRHGGFIPWDDDMDLAMTRQDYAKFLEIAKLELPAHLYIQTTDSDPTYRRYSTPCKVRDKHSRILEVGERGKSRSDLGLFIDILPIDKYRVSGLGKITDRYLRFIYRRLCGWHHAARMRGLGKHAIVMNVMIMLRTVMPVERLLRAYKKMLERKIIPARESLESDYLFGRSYDTYWEYYFKPEWIYPLREIQFEHVKCFCPNDYDAVLRAIYGDYKLIPKPHERPSSHFKILDFGEINRYSRSNGAVQQTVARSP